MAAPQQQELLDRALAPAVRACLFREVNEELRALARRLSVEGELDLCCECALEDCAGRIYVPADLYDEVRRDSTRFLVQPGHANELSERIVAEHDGVVVTEKVGAWAAIAIQSDPRQRGTRTT